MAHYITTEDNGDEINQCDQSQNCLLITDFLHTVFHVFFQQKIIYHDIETFSFRHTRLRFDEGNMRHKPMVKRRWGYVNFSIRRIDEFVLVT